MNNAAVSDIIGNVSIENAKKEVIVMDCPYCGAAMELGTLRNGYDLLWEPGEHTRFTRKLFPKKDDVLLPPKAFLCRACRKIVIAF